MEFMKYQALGNDYLVIQPQEIEQILSSQFIRLLCDHHIGIGADGVLVGPFSSDHEAGFGLQIYNPDGSEAEKSGNGLRIFGRYLYDHGLVTEQRFQVRTKGGVVSIIVKDGGNSIEVNMGRASFRSVEIPVIGPERLILDETLIVEGRELSYNALTLGNPHCVIMVDELSKQDILYLGPIIENHSNFPNRTNVQFVQILSREAIRLEIWERGAGYTLASGSSACAAGVVAYRSGKCNSKINVRMPGGNLAVEVAENLEVSQTGPAVPVFKGTWLSG
jgi:diaminopimelate epimerase